MTRLLLTLVLLAPSLAGGPGQTAPARGSARIIVDAVATDKAGAPVTNLKAEDVEVWIGHFRVPIESFTAVTPSSGADAGRLTILLLDDITMPVQQLGRVRDLARHFVDRMLPGDRMAIVTLDGSGMETTADRAKLLRGIDAYSIRAAGLVPLDRLGEHVLGTLGSLSRQMVEADGGRKTIVAIGSGWVFDRPIPPPAAGMEPRKQWIGAMQAMALANVSLYVIDPSGIGSARVEGGANGFARETGGFAFIATNDLNGAADRIMREASNYYLLGVGDPPVGHGADLRELEVKVRRSGVTIRARRAITGGS